VIEGSVMRSQDQIRIAAELVDAPEDKQIWSSTYEGDLRDLLGLENRVAADVAQKIRIKLSPRETAELSEARPVDPRATEALFKGDAELQQNSPESDAKALPYYELATKLEPNFALAYVDLAKDYNFAGGWGAIPAGQASAGAESALTKALALDPNLAPALEEKAWTLMKFRWNFSEAEADFRRAIELNPGSASAYNGLSQVLVASGRFGEGIQAMAHAQELDPMSLIINSDYCRRLATARLFDRAKQSCAAARALDPNYYFAKVWSAIVFDEAGDYEEANKFWAELDCDVTCQAAHNETSGAPGFHGAFDAWLKKSRPQLDAFILAADYAELGRKDLAFEWLEKAYEQHAEIAMMAFLPVDPRFDNLRSDSRLDEFLHRVGLPPQPREALAKAGVNFN
jgi:adenylate cyclase